MSRDEKTSDSEDGPIRLRGRHFLPAIGCPLYMVEGFAEAWKGKHLASNDVELLKHAGSLLLVYTGWCATTFPLAMLAERYFS